MCVCCASIKKDLGNLAAFDHSEGQVMGLPVVSSLPLLISLSLLISVPPIMALILGTLVQS